jgi:hypothetical protein
VKYLDTNYWKSSHFEVNIHLQEVMLTLARLTNSKENDVFHNFGGSYADKFSSIGITKLDLVIF